MPARVLVLLTTTAAALALTGCGSDMRLAAGAPSPPAGDHPAATAPAKPSADTPRGDSPAKDGTDLDACLDADCEVEVESGQTITLDKTHGADSIDVTRKGPLVTFTIRRGNAKMVTTVGTAGTYASSTYNDITLRPRVTKDGRLILAISPA